MTTKEDHPRLRIAYTSIHMARYKVIKFYLLSRQAEWTLTRKAKVARGEEEVKIKEKRMSEEYWCKMQLFSGSVQAPLHLCSYGAI